ncbi:MAG: NADH-quinone oxidoreductase subunit J [Acidobacteriota bacterium]|jgi:NADH-quinone oxidoreductase subunit J
MMTIVFYVAAFVAFAGALLLVFHRRPLVSALGMAATMLAMGAFYLLLHVPFLAFFQVIIYAGAVMVMALYIIMALGREEPGPDVTLRQSLGALLFAALFLFALVRLLRSAGSVEFRKALPDFGSIREFGNVLVSHYAVPFEIASLILLAAMVGAVVLSRRNWE